MRTVHARPCPECSISFTPDLRRQVCCSPECQKRRTQRKVVLYKAAEPWKITKRDRLGQRGSVALMFAGMIGPLLAIGGAAVDAGYSFVQAAKVRGCAENAALALVQAGRGAAWRIAKANGCRLSSVVLTPGVPVVGQVTATIRYTPVFWWGGQATATARAVGPVPEVSLAGITNLH